MDVTDLIIYKNALKLLEPIYKLVSIIPHNEFELKSQLVNSARAISAQISEGFAKRRSQKEFKRFLEMALGSSDEVITHLRQIQLCRFSGVKEETCEVLIRYYKIESKQINRYISTIDQKIRHPISDV